MRGSIPGPYWRMRRIGQVRAAYHCPFGFDFMPRSFFDDEHVEFLPAPPDVRGMMYIAA